MTSPLRLPPSFTSLASNKTGGVVCPPSHDRRLQWAGRADRDGSALRRLHDHGQRNAVKRRILSQHPNLVDELLASRLVRRARLRCKHQGGP